MIFLEPRELLRSPWDDAEHECGVYFLFLGDELQYVGLACSISTRLLQHRYPDAPSLAQATWFDSVATIEVYDDDERRAIECYYINKLRPPRNVIYPKIGRHVRAMLAR